ncbi:MAG: hydrogenase expression/formation protein HypE [Saprospiraceae bacterium]
MPKFDFDFITLGHGSGGLLTNKLLDSGVFDILKNDILDKRHDGALLNLKGKVAFSTDSFVISPIFFPGGNIGELAVNGTVNDVAMCGAKPEYISLGFIIEEGLPMSEFWEILVGIKNAADKAGVQVVTGDTKVVDKGKGDKIFINTTGIGQVHPKADIDIDRIKPGQKIIVSNQIADHGIAILSVREGLEFGTTIESDTTNLNHVILDMLDTYGSDIILLRDPTRGGLSSTLNEISRDAKTGILLHERSIPVDTQVRAACEILGLDPLFTANEGVFVAIVSEEIAEAMTADLKKYPECSTAAIIGEVVDDHAGKVVITNAMGGKRVISMLIGEQLPRIC